MVENIKIAILDAETLGDDLSFSSFDKIGKTTIYKATKDEEVIKRICDSDVVVLNKIKLNEDILKELPDLKLICITATGYDNVDVEYCKKHNIGVCNVPSYSTDSVTEVTVAMALYYATNLGEFRNTTVNKTYQNGRCFNILTPVFHELKGRTWGIIGYGNIGRNVGTVAKALGMNVLAYSRHKKDCDEMTDLETLLKNSDIISIHTPLNSDSENMINKDTISLMKDDVILINVARGAVVNEYDLKDAILNKKIGALAMDTYRKEPLELNSPLSDIADMDNVCLTPHMAWGAYESRKRCIDIVYNNIKAFVEGKELNRVDKM